ncbi:MAG: CHASE3 domain-containing protein [Caulobacteraceae bacterium]
MGFRGIFAASFALVILLAILTAGFAYNELEIGTSADAWVAHTHEVIEQNEYVLALIQRAESSERAFIISGDPEFLGAYETARARLPKAQAELARLVADNPGEVGRIATLNQAISWRAAQLQRSVDLARTGDTAGAKTATLIGPGGGIGANIRQTSEAITAAEHELLAGRERRVAGATRLSVAIGLGLAALALLALLALVFYLARANARLVRALNDTARANANRERAEQRLREAQRMEAMGQLTGGVAHDFNNLLQVIRGNLELLQTDVGENPAAARRLDNAIHGADRAAQLTRQLLAFARRQPLAAEVINLAALIGDMSDILRRTLGETIEVTTTVAPDLWNALADPAQMESAILNLAINARDAMPGGGRLTIEAVNTRLEAKDLEAADGAAPGDYVEVKVSDTGEGMTPATRERAFEPFFTTKSGGKGSGLGLSMVYGFVRQSNGHIRLESEPGHGTRVSLCLPRSLAQARAASVAPSADRTASETILVVEDDARVRFTVVTMLESLGYRCLVAADAASAIALAGSAPKIDLVFTDVMMPGPVKTREMIEAIRRLRPKTPILFTSGYPEEEIGRHGQLDEDVTLLTKPYAREELAAKIAQVLADTPEG